MKCERWTKTWSKPTEKHFTSCPAPAERAMATLQTGWRLIADGRHVSAASTRLTFGTALPAHSDVLCLSQKSQIAVCMR